MNDFLIQLTRSGDPFWVNPDHIDWMFTNGNCQTLIHIGGDTFTVMSRPR